ncbi:MAG: dihydrolipoyl dehydrogenase [Verrucomicrobiae bacterium]|nr:dihydrolipoyl dehydrogenase [Verrucomicrobiae bacterium]MDW8343786.1 dihydrolipoyl dehydrogenase [Verrucomicrobiae bacterium]
MENYDLIVIGAGPGGYPAAIRGAQLGARVAIVEREQLGGTCLNWGCIPTKALIHAANVFATVQHADRFGIKAVIQTVDYAGMIAHKDKVVGQLRGGIRQLLAANGVTQLTGTARFVDRQTLAVGDQRVRAQKIIIATGSTSAMPSNLPASPRIVESRGFLERSSLPSSLLVMGGGYIGCELACMAALLGVKVTIVELLEDILLLLDADVRREVRQVMEQQLGIRILTGQPMEKIVASDRDVSAQVGNETVRADLLLVAVGRKPVTDGLDLAAAGVKTDDKGFIPVDEFGCTNVATIYAVGDVTGRTQLAHNATSQGIRAAENALGKARSRYESLVPGVIFTVPEVALVGMTETEAKAKNRAVRVGKFRFGGLGRAIAVGETIGFVKWIVDEATDQLVGAAAVGPHATELIAEATVAIRSELTARELGRTIHAHPTFSEVWMEAAHAVHHECVHAPPRRK